MNEQSCCFGNLILLLFCRSRCRRRCSSSLIEEIKHHLFFSRKTEKVTWPDFPLLLQFPRTTVSTGGWFFPTVLTFCRALINVSFLLFVSSCFVVCGVIIAQCIFNLWCRSHPSTTPRNYTVLRAFSLTPAIFCALRWGSANSLPVKVLNCMRWDCFNPFVPGNLAEKRVSHNPFITGGTQVVYRLSMRRSFLFFLLSLSFVFLPFSSSFLTESRLFWYHLKYIFTSASLWTKCILTAIIEGVAGGRRDLDPCGWLRAVQGLMG